MFVRYKLVQAFTTTDKKLSTMNIAALVIGTISCFGMTLVANFQVIILFFAILRFSNR